MRHRTLLRLVLLAAAGILMVPAELFGQTAVWTGLGTDQNYTNGANWQGGVAPPNDGTAVIGFNSGPLVTVNVDVAQNVNGIDFLGSGYGQFDFNSANSLTIGSSGITTQAGLSAYFYSGNAIAVSAPQTWSPGGGFIDFYATISGPGALTLTGTGSDAFYFLGNNTYSGGTMLSVGTIYAGTNSAVGTGPLTLSDVTSLQSWYVPVTLSNAVTVGNFVAFGNNGLGSPLTLSGPVKFTNASTTLILYGGAALVLGGTVTGPASTVLTVDGDGPAPLADQGSQLVLEGGLSNKITGLTVTNASLILAPAGPPGPSVASLLPSGLSVLGYVGLDGTFTQAGAVSSFIASFGPSLGPSINGTFGFDTFANPTSPQTFNDPIDLTNFTSNGFLGLGSATAAILGAGAAITPYNNTYLFGGGGGTLTVGSALTDNVVSIASRSLIMTAAYSPVTVILQGSNTYTGGTTSLGGVLIFDSPLPASGGLSMDGGYVGYTENATNIPNAQSFVALMGFVADGVIGFDSANIGSPRTITDNIDLSGFDSNPFIGTATAVTLQGTITPAGGDYEFTGVKGGQLTVDTLLTGPSNSATIGLQTPIESNASISSVTLTQPNTYGGGTTFNTGQLYVGNNSALGAGTVSVPDYGPSNNVPFLAPVSGGGTVTLNNNFSIASFYGSPGLTVGEPSGADLLILSGPIGDYMTTPGVLAVDGWVTLSGPNSYSGGTTLTGGGSPVLLVTNPNSLGTGPLTVQTQGVLAPSGADVILPNAITMDNFLTLGQNGNPKLLTLNGVITGNGESLDIESNVTLNGINSLTQDVTVNNALVTLSNAQAFTSGPVQLSNSTLSFTYNNPALFDLQGDGPSMITLAPSSTLTLSNDTNSPYAFNGGISGDVTDQVVMAGAGIQTIGGNSTYGGGTTVSSGTLIAGGSLSLGTGPVTVQSGAQLNAGNGTTITNVVNLNAGSTLGGSGTFAVPGGVTFAAGSQVAPGLGATNQRIATLSFTTPVTFAGGGAYGLNVANAAGVAGIDYSTVNVAGNLTISATAISPFTINVASINPGTGDPGLANFNSSLPYTWTLVTAGSIPVFSGNDFTVNSGSFQNALGGGSFSLSQAGNVLDLNFTPVPEPSTWALLLAGLSAAGACIRRRRRAPQL